MSKVRRRVHYLGEVQGVGFRFAASRISQSFEVLGTIENLPDGRVELIAEAEEVELNLFLQAVAEAMKDYIEKIEIEGLPPGSSPLPAFRVVC